MSFEIEVPGDIMKAIEKTAKNPALQGYRGWGSETVQVAHLKDADLDLLEKHVKDADPSHKRLLRKLQIVRKSRSGKGAYKTLEPMAEAIRTFFAKLPNHRFYQEMPDGQLVGYLLTDCTYRPPRQTSFGYTRAYIQLKGEAVRRGCKVEKSENIYTDHLAGGKNVRQLMTELNFVPETPELDEQYEAEVKSYKLKRERTGAQYKARGKAKLEEEEDEGRRWWYGSTETIELSFDGKSTRVVVEDDVKFGKKKKSRWGGSDDDDEGEVDSETISLPNIYTGKSERQADKEGVEEANLIRLPVHPYVRCFDMRLGRYVEVHSEQMVPYRYKNNVFEKLVVPEDRKRLIDLLIASAGHGVDVVEGKGTGVVVLLSGPPGVGKTMTAEVYSEKVMRPLYSVQCSQLGLTPDDLEKTLGTVLERAERWGAILLLDEAEVYIRARGDDVNQNAIVGVFLRVLEYYQGVLFMTTNKEEDVDDAIKSRLTAHVRYGKPSNEQRAVVWRLYCENAGLELSTADINALVNEFPAVSPRTIRNMVRLGALLARQAGKELDLRGIKWASQFLDVEKPVRTEREARQ
jgi:hypothetical protein